MSIKFGKVSKELLSKP